MDNFINTAASDISRARTVGLNQLTPEPFPVLMVGTRSTQAFFFGNRGTIENWSGASNYSLRLSIGDAYAGPIASTFGLTVGSEYPVAVRFDVDQAGLKNILNDSATIAGEGGVDVLSQGFGRFLIAYSELGAPTDIAVDGALLVPDCTADLQVVRTGSSTARQLIALTLTRTLPVQTEAFTPISSPYAGWSGTVNLDSAAAFELLRINGVQRGAYIECPTLLTLEVIDASGNPSAYYQTQITLRALNYMITQSLPVGPSRHAQTSAAAGTVTVAPASQFHEERATFTGAGIRNVVVSPTGLVAGAQVDLSFIVSGADDGMVINVYETSTGGTKWIQFTKYSGDTNAFFSMRATGTGGFENVEQVVPAFTNA